MATTGALPAIQSGASLDPEYQKEYFDALKQSLESLQKRQEPNLLNVAGAFLNPGRTGSFGEALGNAASVVGKQQEEQEARAPQIAQMRAALAGQKFQVAQEAKATQILSSALGGAPIDDVAKALSTPQGALGDPALYQRLIAAQAQISPGTKQAEQIKALLTTQKDALELGVKTGMLNNDQIKTYFQTGMGQLPATAAGAPTPNERPVAVTPSGGNIPAPLRNNNPGAIMKDGKLATFSSLDEGIKATDNLLKTYGDQGINTIAGVISKWAPPSDNNPTPAYIAQVAQTMGVKPDQPLDMSSPLVRNAIATGIFKQENGAAVLASNNTQPTTSGLSPESQQKNILAQQEFQRAQQSAANTETNKIYEDQLKSIAKIDPSYVRKMNVDFNEAKSLINELKPELGEMFKQGFVPGAMTALENGIKFGNFSASIPVYETYLKSKPEKVQEKFRRLDRILGNAYISAVAAKPFGGNPSNFEDIAIKNTLATTRDPYRVLNDFLTEQKITNEHLANTREKFDKFAVNSNDRPYKFFGTQDYEDAKKQYHRDYTAYKMLGAP